MQLSTAKPSTRSHHLTFLRSWMADPLQVAAIAPSGDALARLITREIDLSHAPVLELGPGTGVFTQALLQRGLKQSDLTLVEFGESFAHLLRGRFPDATVLCMDAARACRSKAFGTTEFGAVVSGLPLLSMPLRTVVEIIVGALTCMRDDAAFYQFTYGARCPIPQRVLTRNNLKTTRVGRIIRNLPPATVYRIERA